MNKREVEVVEWTEHRPWGRFKNLWDTAYTKVKVIEVDVGKRLSYQSHSKRKESWTIVKGEARVVLNDQEILLRAGDHIEIPLGAKHRIENRGASIMSFVEVQTGTYFGEDDIVRYQDDFGR